MSHVKTLEDSIFRDTEEIPESKMAQLSKTRNTDYLSKGTNSKGKDLEISRLTRIIHRRTHKGYIAGTLKVPEQTIWHRRERTQDLNPQGRGR